MPAIHLIAKKRSGLAKIPDEADEYEVGDWVIKEEVAQSLVDGDIYLHNARADGAYFGGTILSYRVINVGPESGRVVFRFRSNRGHTGTTSIGGWKQHQKIIP